MSKKSLEDNMLSQFLAIDMCIEKGLFMPSLTLIYSGIDATASLNRPKEKVTQSDFKNWCTDYLIPNSDLNCRRMGDRPRLIIHSHLESPENCKCGLKNVVNSATKGAGYIFYPYDYKMYSAPICICYASGPPWVLSHCN